MKDQLLKDMTPEELAKALDLTKRKGENKYFLQEKPKKEVRLESDGISVTIESCEEDNVSVESVNGMIVISRGREEIFNYKVRKLRRYQRKMALKEKNKPWYLKAQDKIKQGLIDAMDSAIEALEK